MSKTSLEKAVKLVGGQVALAEACDVKQAHVWKWLNTTADGVPEKKVLAVARATNWEITPHELRPDIYPNPHDGLPPEVTAQSFRRRAEDWQST